MLTAGIGNSDLPVPYLLCNMKISRKMVRMKVCVFLVMFLWTVTVSRGETEVSCVFMETCILPCSFHCSTEVQIHWFQLTNIQFVHMYKNNQDLLKHQNRIYRNRTSLFKDQISRGNASLQLTGVKVQDEGLYQCFISTISESKASFVNLKVEAPVNKVNIQQVENNITCSSEGIYPQPELTWSTTPPSNINLHNTTTVQQNEQQLYSISSSLILSDNDTDLVYNCTISTSTNRRRAAGIILNTEVSCVFTERCILPCSFKVGPQVVIHWIDLNTGRCAHSYDKDQDQLTYQEQSYRNRTSLFKDQISRGNASLQLTGVKVQDEGNYICFTNASNEVTVSVISVKVNAPIHEVNIQLVENRITCSSEGIYPQPELTWSTTPPSNINLHNTTTVQKNEQQLYSINGSLILSRSHTDLVYSCTISTPTHNRTTTLSITTSSVNGGRKRGSVVGAVLVAAAVSLFR